MSIISKNIISLIIILNILLLVFTEKEVPKTLKVRSLENERPKPKNNNGNNPPRKPPRTFNNTSPETSESKDDSNVIIVYQNTPPPPPQERPPYIYDPSEHSGNQSNSQGLTKDKNYSEEQRIRWEEKIKEKLKEQAACRIKFFLILMGSFLLGVLAVVTIYFLVGWYNKWNLKKQKDFYKTLRFLRPETPEIINEIGINFKKNEEPIEKDVEKGVYDCNVVPSASEEKNFELSSTLSESENSLNELQKKDDHKKNPQEDHFSIFSEKPE